MKNGHRKQAELEMAERMTRELPPKARAKALAEAARAHAQPALPRPRSDSRVREMLFEGGGTCPDPRYWFQRHENLYAAIVVSALVVVGFLTWHWGHCIFAPTEIHTVEGTTKEIYFVRRHWFGTTEHIKLEARRDENGDWHWMAKSEKTGEWYPFIRNRDD